MAVQLDFSKDDWLQERIRERAERQEGFAEWRATHPLQARLWLGFCGYADSAFEAILMRNDVRALQRSASAMSELASWIAEDRRPSAQDIEEAFRRCVEAGWPIDQAAELFQPPKKKLGRPVSNRWPVMLALEQRMQNPELSWMQLAVDFCRCGQPKHEYACRERIRQQAMVLDEMLNRLGV